MISSPVLSGYKSNNVVVECNISNGLPGLLIVGLASKSVDEAKERLRASVTASGYRFPRKRIVLNLAPADLPKTSSSIDLAMSLAILKSDMQINISRDIVCIGELSLDGDIRPVKGIIGLLRNTPSGSLVLVPEGNRQQASYFANKLEINCVSNLMQAVEYLNSNTKIASTNIKDAASKKSSKNNEVLDFAEIKGQDQSKRALTIAAAGGHSILLSGPPGTGKSMLAKAFIGILPDLTIKESLDTTHIHSIAGYEINDLINTPPLRAPHHTASNVAIVGGGHTLKPGEISLAHNGVLFLDELPEFQKSTLESLRQPLEDHKVSIARAQSSTEYPSRFILIATSNPCPCGYYGSNKACNCSAQEIHRYQKKLSGPIMDRIDIHLNVSDIDHKNLLIKAKVKESDTLRDKVISARDKQTKRSGSLNAHLNSAQIKEHSKITDQAKDFLDSASIKMDISARSYIKIVKIARTIADLDNEESIQINHIAEAIQYRPRQLSGL